MRTGRMGTALPCCWGWALGSSPSTPSPRSGVACRATGGRSSPAPCSPSSVSCLRRKPPGRWRRSAGGGRWSSSSSGYTLSFGGRHARRPDRRDAMETRKNQGQLLWGILLVVLGLLFLSENFGYGPWFNWDRWWPVVLIVIGLGILYRRNERVEPGT